MKRPRLKILYGLFRLALILSFLGYGYYEFYLNRMKEFWEAKNEFEAVSNQLVERLRMRNEVDEFEQKQSEVYDLMMKEVAQRIPTQKLNEMLEEQIDQAALRAEVTLLNVETNEEEAAFTKLATVESSVLSAHAREFRRIPISVKASGRTYNIAHFLSQLLEMDRLLTLEKANITRDMSDFPNVTGDIELFAYFHKK